MMRQPVRGMVAGPQLDVLFSRVVLKTELTPQSVKGGRKKALPMPATDLEMLRKIKVLGSHGFLMACVERGTPWGDDAAWTFKGEDRAADERIAALWVVREMLFHCGCRDATEVDGQLVPHNVGGRGFKDILSDGLSVMEVFQAAGLCGPPAKPAGRLDGFTGGMHPYPADDEVSREIDEDEEARD